MSERECRQLLTTHDHSIPHSQSPSKPPTTPFQPLYHAHVAKTPFGNLLTNHFRPSSSTKITIPNAMGKNQYSAGTVAVCKDPWKAGRYRKKMAKTSAKQIAGSKYQFMLCLRTERRRVRTAKRVNHSERKKKVSIGAFSEKVGSAEVGERGSVAWTAFG